VDGRSIRLSRLGGGNSFGSGGGGGTSIARPNQTLTHSLRKSASVGGRSVGRSASVTGAAAALLIAASGATAIVANEGQSMRLARCCRRRRRHSSAAPLPPSQPTSREPRLAGCPVGRSVGRMASERNEGDLRPSVRPAIHLTAFAFGDSGS